MPILRPAVFKIVALSSVIFMLTLTGCTKCYNCEGLSNEFFLHKGSDSLFLTFPPTLINDSVSYYTAKGHQCDTLHFYWTSTGEFCGKDGYQYALSRGDRCFVKR